MNCQECQHLLHDRLDGLALPAVEALEQHLTVCPDCRDWHTAAGRLEEGLRLLSLPVPPPDLTDRLVKAVLADHGRRRRWVWSRLRTAAALAAGLLLVFLAGDQLRRTPNPRSIPLPEPEPVAVASLRDSVAEAGSAVVNLTRRTADEALDHGKMLFDVVVILPPPETTMPPSPIEPPMRSLATAGQAISAGLEPVADSARRAFGLLMRDVPMQPEDKPGH